MMAKPRTFGNYKIEPVWEGRGQRISWGRGDDGSVALVHSTDYDSGGSRGLVIPDEAVCLVAQVLFGESLRRSVSGIAGRLSDALAEARRLAKTAESDVPEPVAHVPDAYPPSSCDLGRGQEP